MTTVDMGKVAEKLRAFSQTKDGKQKMGDALKEMKQSGTSGTASGSAVVSKADMVRMADELVMLVKHEAASCDLAPSVMDHFDSFNYVVQEQKDGSYEIDFYFEDDLSRESVLPYSGRRGRGIDNIIALFNNGYVAARPKYGWWKDHPPYSAKNLRGVGHENDAFIKTTQARPSLQFMQRAIEEFRQKYGQRYDLTINLNDDYYDGNYGGSLNGVIRALRGGR